LERSTKEASLKRAVDAAQSIIQQEYESKVRSAFVEWDEALSSLQKRMQENNNRPRTIADYLDTLQTLRQAFPASLGPGDITTALAKQFKSAYQSRSYSRGKARPAKVWKGRGRKPKLPTKPAAYSRKARTVASRLNKLRVIWSKWFIEELGYCAENPWADLAPPKVDKLAPRYLTAEEVKAFFDWLTDRWKGWRLPVLFFTVKGFLGNRIGELSSLRSEQLREGRVVFPADETKGRKERKALLPQDVFAELREQAGPVWVWQRFPNELQERLIALDKPAWKLKPEFSPDRLKWWLQDELADYNAAHPEQRRIKAHDFRRKAMTEAWKLGIPLEKAAIAFGCNPNTMRAHYIALDETEVADEVLRAIAERMQQRSSPPTNGQIAANGPPAA
jgi:site-specific recombinase XerD